MKKILIYSIIFYLLIGCMGCSKKTAPRDMWLDQWLNDPVCIPPCWENTTPGKTSLADARTTLSQIPGTRILAALEDHTEFILGDNASGAYYADATGTVQMIWIYFGTSMDLRLDEVITKYGFPSEVSFSFYTPNEPRFNLVYPKLGMVISTYPIQNPPGYPNDPQFDIKPNEKIVGIQFFTPGLEYYLNLNRVNNGPAKILDWKGYGHYSYSK
jgi:hypothetical protein